MNNKEKDEVKVLDHDYDGIKEFDNPLPRWWLNTFYGAIIFGVFYVSYYHLGGPGLDPHQELDQELEKIATQQTQKTAPAPDEAFLLAAYKDPNRKNEGKNIYTNKCAACHGVDGGGMIGPNLTDSYWIHGNGALSSLLQVVSDGVPDKGMPPWKALLKQDEIVSAVVFIKSLQGTRPATPKAPQGTEVK